MTVLPQVELGSEYLQEKEDVSEIEVPEAFYRFLEQRASESHWVN